MTMNPEAQVIFDKILSRLNAGEKLPEHDVLFLRARRSYLTNWQRMQYADILYIHKQFLFQKIRVIIGWIGKFIKEIVIASIVGLIIYWLSKKF